jgi:hypothetical protein
MPYRHRLIDTEKLPPDAREAVITVAEYFNAFVTDLGMLRGEMDQVIGFTLEEKKETLDFFMRLRRLLHRVYDHKMNITLVIIQVWLLMNIMKYLGVETEDVAKIMAQLLSMMGKP